MTGEDGWDLEWEEDLVGLQVASGKNPTAKQLVLIFVWTSHIL